VALPTDEPVNIAAQPAGWRGAWTAPRARLWLVAGAIAAYLPLLGVPLRSWLDFSSFYAAGKLAFTPDVARLAPIVQYQVQHGLPPTPFVYPAGVALLYVPFSWLPYDLAAALHVALTAALLVVAAAWGAKLLGIPRNWAILGALAWGPAAAGVISGQNSSDALLLVVAAAAGMVRGRDRISGIAAGLLTYKPQLGAPIAGLFLLRRRWEALAWVVAFIGVEYLLGVLATGGNLAWPRDWIETLSQYTNADFHDNGWQAISLPALGTRFELLIGLTGLGLLGFMFGAIAVIYSISHLRKLPALESVALACALGLLISPHAWVYDATLLLPAVGVFARGAMRRGWPWQDRWLLVAAYVIGLTWALGGFVGITLVPLLVVGAPIVLVRARWATPIAVSAAAPPP
jgi:alpha-1,2-mannosyltransferase